MASYYSGANLQPDAMQTLYLTNPDYTGYADMTNPGSMLLLNQSVASVPTSVAASGQPHHYVGIQYPQAPSPKHSSVDSLESSGSQHGINSALLASRFRNPGYGTWRNVGNELSFIQAADPSPLTQPLSEKITGYSAVDHQSVSEIVPTAIKRSNVSSVQNQQLNINSNAISLQLDQSHVSEAQVHGLSLSLSPQQLSNIQLSCFQNHPSEQNVDCPSISEETSHENINMLDRISAKFSDNAGSFRSPRDVMPATNFLTMANGHQLDKSSQHSSNTYTPLSNSLTGSKYFRAAQELLDEVVNVGKGTKFDKGKYQKSQALSDMKNMTNEANINDTPASAITGSSACANETKSENPAGISAADRQELQMKKAKLVAMLNEVDRRYRQYYHQMQIVVSMFEAAAGYGSAKTYTSLALKTISRHFRSLRDAIATQIRLASKNLGEEDPIGTEQGETSRLHFVDQQLRQQRALQQLGMLQQHAWRPQRGLPERAVSILRAWLFEHFLHPYPKDADKIYLARQTGLTRSQVSNWFINARVRLWKPMVEEMYTEEVKEAESNANATEAKSTTESAQNKKEVEVNDTRNRDCRRDEKSSNCPNTKNNEASQLHQQGTDNMNFKSDHASIGIDNESHRLGIASLSDNGMFNTSGEDLRQGHHKKLRNGLHDSIGILPTSMAANVGLRPEEGSGYILDNSKFSSEDKHVSEDYSYSNNKMLQLEDSSEFGSYHIDGLSRYGQDPYAHKFSGFGGVSLTLGLQHCDDLTLSGTHQSYSSGQLGLPSGRSDLGTESGHLHHMHNGTGVGGENEFETINLHNGKRYASQMLHDFVA